MRLPDAVAKLEEVAEDTGHIGDESANATQRSQNHPDLAHEKRKRRRKRRLSGGGDGKNHRNRRFRGANAPPKHVHCNDWREMLALTANNLVGNLAEQALNKSETELLHVEQPPINRSATSLNERPLSPADDAATFFRMRAPTEGSTVQHQWIEQTFSKRECAVFIASSKDPNKCGCGRARQAHSSSALAAYNPLSNRDGRKGEASQRWTISRHTVVLPTDAYGTVEFQGGPHPFKAQYLRANFDTDPADIMNLFDNVWELPKPTLIITVHGGITNFDLQPKLARVFRKGLLKAARTTGAWIITSGINAGVVRHVAAALEGAISTSKARSKIVSIGIAPWGLLKKREDFVGQDKIVSYHPHSFSPKGRFAVLNNRHSYFLLVDNGTIGRYGADIILRRRLESYIAEKRKIGGCAKSVPVVCVILEGGTCTVRTILDYVTNIPRVPVVICDGSGRASDLIAFAHQWVGDDGNLPEGVRLQLLNLVQNVFQYDTQSAQCLIQDILACVRQKHLVTVFRLGENGKQDVDYAILTALLKGQNLSAPEQLLLALAWNRVDIARSDIFVMGQHWPKAALHNAMMDALIHNRVDFVRLLLENGVSMHDFLTIGRLEELYNTDQGPPNTLYYIVRDVVKIRSGYRYKLTHIGLAIEKLMANGFRSHYTSSEFRRRYIAYRNRRKEIFQRERNKSGRSASEFFSPVGSSLLPVGSGANLHDKDATIVPAISGSRALSNHILWRSAFRRDNYAHPAMIAGANLNQAKDAIIEFEDETSTTEEESSKDFKYPFSDLLIWAVLTKRHEMAQCMWQHGEEALAKALVACRLYKSLSKEAAEDYLEVEICDELRKYAEEFRELSLELLDHCYRHDDTQTLQLLTYELSYWGKETCLSIAVMVNHKQFLAHPCCQILLADLWHGGLRIRSNSNLKVILGILFPPSIFLLEFKSREELLLQPQTAVEHEDDINDTETSSSESSSSSSDDSETDDEATDASANPAPGAGLDKRRMSTSSVQSHNLASLFQNRRTRRRNRTTSRASHSQQADGKDIEMNAKETTDGKQSTTLAVNNLSVTKASGGFDQLAAPRKRLRTLSWRQNGPHPANTSSEEQGYQASSPETTPRRKSTLGRKVNRVDPVSSMANGAAKGGLPAIPLPEGITLSRKRQIKFRRKFYEFFAAPITTFWSWSLSFVVFLSALTYVLLVRTPAKPSVLEWILFAYVVAFGLEITRKFFMSEPDKFKEKLEYFMFNYWNALTTLAIIGHVIGFGFRLVPAYSETYGRIILAVNFVLWSIKLLDFLSVHPRFGPYITMSGKMIMNMTPIVVMLLISLLGFGLARQSITYPDEEWHWLLVRNIFYKPYFMLYGEVYADEIDTCGDEGKACVPGHWVPPLLMTVFLLIANILLISMLIAIFNNIFDMTSKISQQIWLFQRYRQVIEYESTPFLPPPFTPLYHCYMVVRYIRYRLKRRQSGDGKKGNSEKERSPFFDFSLKLFLIEDQVEKLHDFEEECMEEMERAKEYERNRSSEERLHRTAERTDLILVKLNDFSARETLVKGNIRELENRLEVLEERQSELLDCMRQITSCLPAIVAALPIPAQHALPAAPPSQQPPTPPTGALHVDVAAVHHTADPHSRRLTVSGTPSQYTSSETVVAAPHHTPRSVPHPQTAPVLEPSASPPSFPPASDFASRRMRTTTIAGADLAGAASHVPVRHQPAVRFGSLLSLDPRMLASPSSKTTGSVRRRRRHDEYTSITDAINIEEIERMNALGVGITSGSATVAASTSAPLSEGALYSEDDDHHDRLHPLHEGVHTEDDIEDEESDVAEDSVEPVSYQHAMEDDSLNITQDTISSSDELHNADTPTTTLRRAKQSFVQQQNTILKDYEEEVGGLSGTQATTDQSDNDLSRDSPPSEAEFPVKRRRETIVEPRDEPNEPSHKPPTTDRDSDGSKEFIQFLGLSDKQAREQAQHAKFSSASTEEAADDGQPSTSGRFEVTPLSIPPTQAAESDSQQRRD